MSKVKFVTALPETLKPHTFYVVQAPGYQAELFTASAQGMKHTIVSKTMVEALADARVQLAISNLVGTASESLDTIQELAEAFNNNPDALNNLTAAVALKADADNVYSRDEVDAKDATLNTAIAGKQDALANAESLAKIGEGTYDGMAFVTVGETQW